MRKGLLVILFWIYVASSIIFAQTEDKKASAPVNNPQKIDYSETVPYTPRVFKNEKSQKEDKSNKNSKKEIQIPSSINSPQNSVVEDSLVETSIAIPVLVFDATGNAVENLEKSDFKIFVDDEEHEISGFGTYDQPLNLILILDASPSMALNIKEIQKYAATIVGQLRPQDKVMVITFDERTKVLTELTQDRAAINKAIKKADFGDGTSLYEAVKYSVQKKINQIEGRKLVVLLSDGVDTTSRNATFEDSLLEAEKSDAAFFVAYIDTQQAAWQMKKNNPMIDKILQQIISQNKGTVSSPGAIDAEYKIGRQYINDLTLLSGGIIIKIENLSKINKTGFEPIFEAYRKQYYLNFNSSGNDKIGQRKQIKVRVNRPNLFVQARGSYIVSERKQTLPINSK